MIELKNQRLEFSFPEVHPEARLSIEFQRTLRIPDDNRSHSLPPGLGPFPIQHVDDHAANVPEKWLQRGGVMIPMYQSEAMWLNFNSRHIGNQAPYPFAIKFATGKQCAVTGNHLQDGLQRSPQNYMVAPRQPWLDGYVVRKGLIRQFVAMPLGSGYTAEEQLTGQAEHGGLQIEVYPMRRDEFESRFPPKKPMMLAKRRSTLMECFSSPAVSAAAPDMGLAPGGKMKQEIYKDKFGFQCWNMQASSRCFVHICNSVVWGSVTGKQPPYPAPTARQYTNSGLPWFEYYDESAQAVEGSSRLADMESVAQLSQQKQQMVLPENESVTPQNLVVLRQGLQQGQVREGHF